jgi:YesN/AraC family two-component response regulator
MARILLIDDDDSARSVLRLMLNQSGHLVIEARNGVEGMNLFMQANTDLVITDIIMPEKEGLELMKEMRRMVPSSKIIVISGGGRVNPKDYLRMAKHLGASRVLAKPISRDALIGAVNELLLPTAKAPVQPGPAP